MATWYQHDVDRLSGLYGHQRILSKLGVRDRVQAVLRVLEAGLI